MLSHLSLEILVLAALTATSVYSWKAGGMRPLLFWGLMAFVVASSSAWALLLLTAGWRTDFGTALWLTVDPPPPPLPSSLIFGRLRVGSARY